MSNSSSRDSFLNLTIGTRRLGRFRRRLMPYNFSLEEMLADKSKDIPVLETRDDGYVINSIPLTALRAFEQAIPNLVLGQIFFYTHHYIDMSVGIEDYLASFSSKTRSGLRRKSRKLAAKNNGNLDIREYRTETEIEEFFKLASKLSLKTYQERMLDAGLPIGEKNVLLAKDLARAGQLRAFLLFFENRPISYLYLPVNDATLIYAYLGYDPEFAHLSPGTVLQYESLILLFKKPNFKYFDFTSGDGAHKRLFANASIECCSTVALRHTFGNKLRLLTLTFFNSFVDKTAVCIERMGIKPIVRKLLRKG